MSPEESTQAALPNPQPDALPGNAATAEQTGEHNILDMLMQQVEAQSSSDNPLTIVTMGDGLPAVDEPSKAAQPQETTDAADVPPADVDMAAVETQALEQIQSDAAAATTATTATTHSAAAEQPAEREWETDSSPYESSDSDTSLDDSSSEDDSDADADGDYAMMNPEEAARILMDDAGSDDEGKNKDNTGATLRTVHERPEEIIPKPDVTVTEDMQIQELGDVEFVVENTVVVKAKTTGEYQVLESGSVLCLQDRTVIGAVAETIGRVEQPMYTVRFTNEDAIKEAGVFEKGTTIYYVQQHSTFVFTQPLKGMKGSDASNIHDEEVGDDEMEFSDDEKEAEHKRQLKLKRQGRKDDGGRGGRGRGRGGQHGGARLPSVPEANGASGALDYDDGEGYTPLSRPANLHEMMTGAEPGEIPDGVYPTSRPNPGRGGFQNNRGGRGRGRGGPNSRGGRGGGGYQQAQPGYHHQVPNISNPNNQNQNQNQPAPFHFPGSQYPGLKANPPAAPQIAPHGTGASFPNMPFSPSPISPLPTGSFNFQQPGQFPNFAGMPPPPPPPPQALFNFGQQQPGQPSFAANQAAFAQVQRQLAEMQRASQGQNQQHQYPQGGGYQG